MPKLEDIVLIVAVVLGLSIALYLSYAMVVQGSEYPPTLISTFIGVALAALIYRFMGGLAGTEFAMGLLKLGGSAAFIAGMIWFIGDRLRTDRRLYVESRSYVIEIEAIEKQRDDAIKASGKRLKEIEALRKQLQDAPTAQGTYSIAEIKKMKPSDQFVQDIKALVVGQEYPFIVTLKDMTVQIAVIGGLGNAPAFQICRDTLSELNEGVQIPNPSVRLSRTQEDGNPASVNATRMGFIGADHCDRPRQRPADKPNEPIRDFDVQINCAAARELFQGLDSSCSGTGTLRGTKIAIGSLSN